MKKITFILILFIVACCSQSLKAQTLASLKAEQKRLITQRDSISALYIYTIDQYDSLLSANIELEKKLQKQRLELDDLTKQIENILKIKEESQEEFKKAKEIITQLVARIDELEAEVKHLKEPKKKQ